MPAAGDKLLAAGSAKIDAGSVTLTFTGTTSATGQIVFEAGLFTAPPFLTVTIVTGSGSAVRATAFATTVSATQATIRVDLNAAASVSFSAHWIAVQS